MGWHLCNCGWDGMLIHETDDEMEHCRCFPKITISNHMTNEQAEQHLINLMAEWCGLISGDHHKDRDCHFEVVKRWSYGGKPYYYICHNGYLFGEQEELKLRYETYAQARSALAVMIARMKSEYQRLENE